MFIVNLTMVNYVFFGMGIGVVVEELIGFVDGAIIGIVDSILRWRGRYDCC